MKVSELNIPLSEQCEGGNFLLPAGTSIAESEETTHRIAAEVARPDVIQKKSILIITSIKSF